MIKGVIFDMDGVMIDTERQSNLGWLEAAKKQGRQIPVWLIDKFKGAPAVLDKKWFDEYFGGELDYFTTKELRTQHIYELRKTEGIPVKYGLYELLEFIRQNNMHCAVATSTRRESAEKTLHEIGAYSYLDSVVFGDEVEHGKPEPDIFLKAASAIGLNPCECIVIEDSINGIKAGFAAGIRVIYVPDTITIDDDIRKMTFAICRNLSEVRNVIAYLNDCKIKVDKKHVYDAFKRYTSVYGLSDIRYKKIYDRALEMAGICEKEALKKQLSITEAEYYYALGLLHNIGKFEIIRRSSPEAATAVSPEAATKAATKAATATEAAAFTIDILFKDGLIEAFIPELMKVKGLKPWKDAMDIIVRLNQEAQ